MKIVITGGSGFIGSFIAEQLAEEGNDVVIYDIARPRYTLKKNMTYVEGDIRYLQGILDITKGADEVYDIAGVLGTSELMSINSRAVDTNIIGALNVLEACKTNNVKSLLHPTKPNDWLNTYSITKFAAEQFCLMYQKYYGMNITVLRWFNAYGPREYLYPVRKVVPSFIIQAMHNKELQIYGDGEQTVDLIYVTDIAKIAIKAARTCGQLGKVIDVGRGIPLTVNNLAKLIIKMCKSSSKIVYLPMRLGEPERSNIKAEIVDLKKYVKINKFVDIEEGMKYTIDYYRGLEEGEVTKAFEYLEITNNLIVQQSLRD